MSDIRYFNLRIPAPQRLAMMHRDFEAHAARYPNCPESAKPKTWRDVRAWGFHNWDSAFGHGLDSGSNSDGPVWYTHGGEHFRGEKFADEIVYMRHTGWNTNHDGMTYTDGSGLCRGIVGRLTHGRFIAGYWWGDNGERVWYPQVFTDQDDAARAADSHAEKWAEVCREDSEKYDAMQDCENSLEKALGRLRECLALRHRECMAYVRDEVADLIETIRECRARLAGEFADMR